MKTNLQKKLLAIACLLCCVGVYAHEFEVDGIYYNITSETNQTVEVTYYGERPDYVPDEYKYKGVVIIPESVIFEGVLYNVTSIGLGAFEYSRELESVTLPNTIQLICRYAFDHCSLKDIIIPNSVTEIKENAFSASDFESITLSCNITNIEDGLCQYCYNLNSIIIPASVISIGANAFASCKSLVSIEIPENIISIGDYAFSGCQDLTTVKIPFGLSSVGYGAFYGCTSLDDITLPESVTSVSGQAFDNTPFYNSKPDGLVYFDKVLYKYKGKMPNNTTLSVEDGTVCIADYAFYHCPGLVTVTIPNSVKTIGAESFNGCSSLSSLTIGSGVEAIGRSAFYTCGNLNTIIVDANNPFYNSNGNAIVETSTNILLRGCKNTIIPDCVTVIGLGAFSCTNGMTTITIPDNVVSIDTCAFISCEDLVDINIPEGVTTIGHAAFAMCNNLKSVILPNSLTYIDSNVFKECFKLEEASLGENVEFIGESAFSHTNIKSVIIPSSVTSLGNYAFEDCVNLNSVVVADGIDSLGYSVFSGCEELEKITLGSSVSYIGEFALEGCSALKEITMLAVVPPVVEKRTFDDEIYSYAKLKVRYGCKTAYEDAKYWKKFSKIEELPSDNHFEVEAVSASRGSEFVLPVSLTNDIAISGFQADLYLPAGVDIKPGNENKSLILTDRASDSHVISAARQSDGAIKILAYSNKAEAFAGNDGILFAVKLDVANNFNGECLIQLKNITLTAPDNSEYPASDLDINVTMVAPEKGDANSDGRVNVSDINTVANYILQPEVSHINITQADVASNGKINVIDLVGIANIILGDKPHTNVPMRMPARYAENSNRFYIENFNLAAGEEREIAIVLDNNVPFTAFQTDICLPAGLSIKQDGNAYDIALTNRKDGHVISAAKQADSAVRILAYSTSSKNFNGNNGALVTFTIVADKNFVCGDIVLKNTFFSQADMTEYQFDNEYIAVNGGNGVDRILKDNWYISISNGSFVVNGMVEDAVVYVYSINGILLHRATVAEVSTIALPSGIYLVCIDGVTKKIVM